MKEKNLKLNKFAAIVSLQTQTNHTLSIVIVVKGLKKCLAVSRKSRRTALNSSGLVSFLRSHKLVVEKETKFEIEMLAA